MRHEDDRDVGDDREVGGKRGAGHDRGAGDDREIGDEPDFADEHAPSQTDPPNAQPDDGNPDEQWENPTEV